MNRSQKLLNEISEAKEYSSDFEWESDEKLAQEVRDGKKSTYTTVSYKVSWAELAKKYGAVEAFDVPGYGIFLPNNEEMIQHRFALVTPDGNEYYRYVTKNNKWGMNPKSTSPTPAEIFSVKGDGYIQAKVKEGVKVKHKGKWYEAEQVNLALNITSGMVTVNKINN